MFKASDSRNRTAETLSYIDIMEGYVKNMKEDPEKEKRQAEHFCRACYYDPERQVRQGDRSLCVVCHDSTVTDSWTCGSCAGKYELCKRCGADIDLRGATIIKGDF